MDVGTLTTNAHNLGLTYNDTRTRPVADLGPPWVTAVVLARPPRELQLACRLELLLAGLMLSRMDAAAPLDDHEVRSARKLRPSWPAARCATSRATSQVGLAGRRRCLEHHGAVLLVGADGWQQPQLLVELRLAPA